MNKLRNLIGITLVSSLFLLSSNIGINNVYAESNTKNKKDVSIIKLGTIDLSESSEFADFSKIMQSKYQESNQKLLKGMEDMQKSYEKKNLELEQKKDILDSEKFKKAVDDLQKKYEQEKSDYINKSKVESEKMMQEIQGFMNIVNKAAEKVAKEHSVDLIIDKNAIIFLDEKNSKINTTNITDQVVKKFMQEKEIKKFIKDNS